MTTVLTVVMLVFALSCLAMAEEWTGYIADANCAAKQGAKAASDGHAGCAQGCIKKGAAAVLGQVLVAGEGLHQRRPPAGR